MTPKVGRATRNAKPLAVAIKSAPKQVASGSGPAPAPIEKKSRGWTAKAPVSKPPGSGGTATQANPRPKEPVKSDSVAAQGAAPDFSLLKANPRFVQLDDATKAETANLFERYRDRPGAAKNVQTLITSEEFARLQNPVRKEALSVLALAPEGAPAADLTATLKSSGFAALPTLAQTAVVRQLGAQFNQDSGRRFLLELVNEPALSTLPADDAARLVRLTGGRSRQLSQGARAAYQSMTASTPYQNADTATRAGMLNKFLTDQPGAPHLVSGNGVDSAPPGAPFILHAPKMEEHAFQGKQTPALLYEMEVDGRRLPIYVPRSAEPSQGNQHSIAEVAQGLAALPAVSRNLVKSVEVHPLQNAHDAHWQTVYKNPNHRSYMTAGAEGNVSLYPVLIRPTQAQLNETLIHETGHVLSGSKWDTITDGWKPWEAAIGSDGVVASAYAKSSRAEDFAETLALYYEAKGTDAEAEIRSLMPARFKIIDRMLAEGTK